MQFHRSAPTTPQTPRRRRSLRALLGLALAGAALTAAMAGPAHAEEAHSYAAQIQQPINPDNSSVFPNKRGAIPVRVVLTDNGAVTTAPDAHIAYKAYLAAGGVVVTDQVASVTPDSDGMFRKVGGTYQYNLATSVLDPGQYQIRMVLDDGTVLVVGWFQIQ